MKPIKINFWNVTGYRGHSDYDGPQDNNFCNMVAVDSRFTKDEVLDMMFKKFSAKYRVVVLSATLVKTVSEDGRIHAHWIEEDTSDRLDKIHKVYTCSNCRDTETWIAGRQGQYCPGCGAIMDDMNAPSESTNESERKCTSLEEFAKVHCEMCGTQRCGGVYDEEMREGCEYYQKEILGQQTLHEMIEEINKQKHPATWED